MQGTSANQTRWSGASISVLLAIVLALALSACAREIEPPVKPDNRTTIIKSTMYIKTHRAVANILPGGRNTPFTGVPVAEMMGADSADVMLEDIVIPGLNQPVTGDIELILLNEKNIEPFILNGKEFDFFYTLNPRKRSLGTMTVVQTKLDDHGPGYEGVYMRELSIDLIATLVPKDGGPKLEQEATIIVSSPLPIPFSFDSGAAMVHKTGTIGDATASLHSDKKGNEKNIFGLGLLQIPLGGRSAVDSQGFHAMAGNVEQSLLAPSITGDNCPFDANKIEPGITGCGVSDLDTNNDGLPDHYESTLLEIGTNRAKNAGILYDPKTGEIGLSVPDGVKLIAVSINSASGIFNQRSPANLGGALDKASDVNIFKATFGTTFGPLNFGTVAKPGLSKDFILKDVTARMLFDDYVNSGGLQLKYGPLTKQ